MLVSSGLSAMCATLHICRNHQNLSDSSLYYKYELATVVNSCQTNLGLFSLCTSVINFRLGLLVTAQVRDKYFSFGM